MTLCVNSGCRQPENPDTQLFCASCGSKLLLKERYRPMRLLGSGGFGRTFLAIDDDIPSKPRCAVKQFHFLNQNPEFLNKAVELFEREAVRLDSLGSHAQIPTLLAFFKHEQRLYLVQQFIEGMTLEQELRAYGVYDEAKIWQLLQDLLPILQFIHLKQVIHRDIKPENIIRDARTSRLVLIDFGVAKVLTETALVQQGTSVGSLDYAPPEQMRGKVFPASDLYSLGVTCIRLMTGVRPSEMYDVEHQTWLWRQFLPEGIVISDYLGEILDRLLHHNPSSRYQSAQEVIQLLQTASAATLITHSQPAEPATNINTSIPSSISSPIATQNLDTVLTNQVAVVYVNLERNLSAKIWKQADEETWQLMCLALGKPFNTILQSNDLHRLPGEVFRKIDQLWVSLSQGRFGFSVQKQIYDSVNKDYVKFCDRVKWLSYNSPNYYEKLVFTQYAPTGHLPSRIWSNSSQWRQNIGIIGSKLAKGAD